MTTDVFAVPVFIVVFRETLETVIIVSILLAFLKQTLDGPERDPKVYKKLLKQVSFHLVASLPAVGCRPREPHMLSDRFCPVDLAGNGLGVSDMPHRRRWPHRHHLHRRRRPLGRLRAQV